MSTSWLRVQAATVLFLSTKVISSLGDFFFHFAVLKKKNIPPTICRCRICILPIQCMRTQPVETHELLLQQGLIYEIWRHILPVFAFPLWRHRLKKKKKKATDSLTMYMQNLPAQASKTEHEVKCPFYWSQEQSFAFFASQAKCSSSTVRLIDHKRILFCQLATVSQWIWMWRPMYKACVHTAQMQHCLSLTSLAHCNCQSTGPIEFT